MTTNNQLVSSDFKSKIKSKKIRIILVLLGIIIILITIFLYIPIILNLFTSDIAPINDSDLKLKKTYVSNEDNAYFDLKKINNVIYWPKDKQQKIIDMSNGKTWDDKFAQQLLSQNTQTIQYFHQAIKKTKYQNPEIENLSDINLDNFLSSININDWLDVARINAIQSLYILQQGKDKEALDEALNSLKLGQKIQDSQLTLIEYLVASKIKEIGLETIRKIISVSKLPTIELKQYIQKLNEFYENENNLITVLKVEYNIHTKLVDEILRKISEKDIKELQKIFKDKKIENFKFLLNNYHFKPNKTKLLFAEYTKSNINKINQSCEKININTKQSSPENFLNLYLKENAIGKILYYIFATDLNDIITIRCEENLLVGATQIMIAIKAFKNDNNNYPNSLDELVPNYLSFIPKDPFDGKSIKYSNTKKIIYSVGKDLIDSGGSTGNYWVKMPDPTFIIDF